MARHNGAASLASAAVIAIAGGFYGYAVTRQPEVTGTRRYGLQAIFLSSNGLKTGADVRLAGVRIGTVSSITLDPAAFVTRIGFDVDDRYRLPADTSLGVGSSGFTSANALLVDPGHASRSLSPGDTIRNTHEMLSLEQTVSQYIFGDGGLGAGAAP